MIGLMGMYIDILSPVINLCIILAFGSIHPSLTGRHTHLCAKHFAFIPDSPPHALPVTDSTRPARKIER
jgi:hypothetical protein